MPASIRMHHQHASLRLRFLDHVRQVMPVIPAQSRSEHDQVEPPLVERRLHGLSPPGLLQCRGCFCLCLRIPLAIKNLQLRCFRHECRSSPLTVATPHSSEYITEDQQQPGKSGDLRRLQSSCGYRPSLWTPTMLMWGWAHSPVPARAKPGRNAPQTPPDPSTKLINSKSSSPPPVSALNCFTQRGLSCSALASSSPFSAC